MLGTFIARLKTFFGSAKNRKANLLSASLANYLALGAVPFCYIVFKILSLFDIKIDYLIDNNFPDAIDNLVNIIKSSNAFSGQSISLFSLIVTLYGATKLFYNFKRCGEILYEYSIDKIATYKYILSFFVMLIFLSVVTCITVIAFWLKSLLKLVLGNFYGVILNGILLTILGFLLCLSLNAVVCPYRFRTKELIYGSIFTTVCWLILTIGFNIYLNYIGDMSFLYGALSFVVVFLLIVYFFMKAFVYGVVVNILTQGRLKRKKT